MNNNYLHICSFISWTAELQESYEMQDIPQELDEIGNASVYDITLC